LKWWRADSMAKMTKKAKALAAIDRDKFYTIE
jgi:hypothetical protein